LGGGRREWWALMTLTISRKAWCCSCCCSKSGRSPAACGRRYCYRGIGRGITALQVPAPTTDLPVGDSIDRKLQRTTRPKAARHKHWWAKAWNQSMASTNIELEVRSRTIDSLLPPQVGHPTSEQLRPG